MKGAKVDFQMEHIPRVLLLGDSIRMSYQPIVAKNLQGVAKVVGPEENCQYSLYTLAALQRWLNQLGKPDIVHWNNGIHDAGYNPNRSSLQIPIEMYRLILEFILQRLQETGAQIIWATSTPVHPKRPFVHDQWSWKNEHIEQYNRVALDLMKSRGVPVNNLHSIVMSDIDRYLCDDLLHLSEAGKEKCAEAVVAAIKAHLPKPKVSD
jgi:lysophospholipase L1-like esterase